MKKMWKIRKDSKAVSPVIATILMVAITVVLAAVLYVMVMGFGGGEAQTPTGSFTVAEKQDSGVYRLKIGEVTPETNWNETTLAIAGSNSDKLDPTATSISVGSYFLNVTDLAGDDKISQGDYIEVSTLSSGDYTANLIYGATGGSIAEISFTMA